MQKITHDKKQNTVRYQVGVVQYSCIFLIKEIAKKYFLNYTVSEPLNPTKCASYPQW